MSECRVHGDSDGCQLIKNDTWQTLRRNSLPLVGIESLLRNTNLSGVWHPGFLVNHFVKDLGISLQECQSMGLALPGLALVSFPSTQPVVFRSYVSQ